MRIQDTIPLETAKQIGEKFTSKGGSTPSGVNHK